MSRAAIYYIAATPYARDIWQAAAELPRTRRFSFSMAYEIDTDADTLASHEANIFTPRTAFASSSFSRYDYAVAA